MGQRRTGRCVLVRILVPSLLVLSITVTWNLLLQLLLQSSSSTLWTMVYAAGVPPSLTTMTHLVGSTYGHDDDSPSSKSKKSIAFMTTIAFCANGRAIPERKYSYRDAPAVLAHSIRMTNLNSQYTNYTLYAIVHPQAYDCSKEYLKDYHIIIQESPVLPNDVATIPYRTLIKMGGCCGAREFLKLYAYNMTNHDAVVHFDADTIMLQPMDELFNVMFYPTNELHFQNIPLMRPDQRPLVVGQTIDAFMTRDYIQGNPHLPYDATKFAMQGGFFVIRPSQTVFMEMIGIIQRGNYTHEAGWEGSQIGNFYGAAQIQGFLAYYYSIIHPEDVVELNRCRYNTMIYDEPKLTSCRTCEDCRITPLHEIKSVHFTTCQKPWSCTLPNFGIPPISCQHVQHLWFQIRRDLEMTWRTTTTLQSPQDERQSPTTIIAAAIASAMALTSTTDYTLGYCLNGTYQPMTFPQ